MTQIGKKIKGVKTFNTPKDMKMVLGSRQELDQELRIKALNGKIEEEEEK